MAALQSHLRNEHGLFELDPPDAPLHFQGGVLEVASDGTRYTLRTRERTPEDALSAETCLPYSIEWIAAALGHASRRLKP